MARNKKHSRLILTIAAVVLIGGAMVTLFWPRAILVDVAEVRTGSMIVTINEEGRTKVKEPYTVSTPIAGELQRVTVLPGEKVVKGETVVAHMRPVNPSALDVRTREQARAVVTAAEAALRVGQADLIATLANLDFANSELKRTQQLVERSIISKVTMERAEQAARVAEANVGTVRAVISVREAELENAHAQLIGFDDMGLASAIGSELDFSRDIPLRAPVDGTILQVIQKSETTLPAGQPILTIGDIDGDLEIVAELLSSDAVQVTSGDRVIVTNWGGTKTLPGKVSRIDPYGFTKHSALGIEEQRVETIIEFTPPGNGSGKLGHGYRVEVRIVIWEKDDALIVPSSALFRHNQAWAVFQVDDGKAKMRPIQVGENNGIEAEVVAGLALGDAVVLFPSASLEDGQLVNRRTTE
jgi:HlyD family secretion protein